MDKNKRFVLDILKDNEHQIRIKTSAMHKVYPDPADVPIYFRCVFEVFKAKEIELNSFEYNCLIRAVRDVCKPPIDALKRKPLKNGSNPKAFLDNLDTMHENLIAELVHEFYGSSAALSDEDRKRLDNLRKDKELDLQEKIKIVEENKIKQAQTQLDAEIIEGIQKIQEMEQTLKLFEDLNEPEADTVVDDNICDLLGIPERMRK